MIEATIIEMTMLQMKEPREFDFRTALVVGHWRAPTSARRLQAQN